MSPEQTFTEQGSNRSRLILIANYLAVLGVVLACCAFPLHPLPILSVAISWGVAIALGTIGLAAFRNPSLAIFLPLIAILTGATVGVVSIAEEFRGDWVILLGNLQAISVRDSLIRFLVGFVAIGTLAAFCTSQLGARRLLIFAISGPGLFLVYLLRSELETLWPDAGRFTINGLSLAGLLLLLIVWKITRTNSLVLERFRNVIGHKAVTRALNLKSPTAIHGVLSWLDELVDPLGELESAIKGLLQADTVASRQKALSRSLEILNTGTYALPLQCRNQTETAIATKPEAHIILALDDFLRKQPEQTVKRLEDVASALLLDPGSTWIADSVRKAFAKKAGLSSPLTVALQNITLATQVAVFAGESDNRQSALKQIVDELRRTSKPLPKSFREQLNAITGRKLETLVLLAEDDFVGGRTVDGFICLSRLMYEVAPDIAWMVNATLDAWEQHLPSMDTQVQQALWERTKSGNKDSKPALGALATTALQRGLRPEFLQLIKGRPVERG